MDRELAHKQSAQTSNADQKKKEEEEKQNAEQKAKGEKEGDDGKLSSSEVQNFPDDCEEIVQKLKSVEFAKQDLEVLIELSKQLKFKRLSMFPERDYVSELAAANLTPDRVARQQ